MTRNSSPTLAREPGDAPLPSLARVWALWAAVGWAVLLGLAALALAFHWIGLGDALDARRLFR